MNNKLLIKYLSFPESYINDSNYNLLKQLLINYKDNSEGKEKELLERLFDKLSNINDKEEFVKLLWDFDEVVYQDGTILNEEFSDKFDLNELSRIETFKERVDYCSNRLQKLGSGSSRIVYKLNDSALKLAYNYKGIAQNEEEVNQSSIDYGCTTKVLSCDNEFYFWVVSELATPAKEDDFKSIWGLTFSEVQVIISAIHDEYSSKKLLTTNSSKEYSKKLLQDNVYNEKNIDLYHLYCYLIDYQPNHIYDFLRVENWGVIKRSNKEHLIIIDSGLSDEIGKKYYHFNESALDLDPKELSKNREEHRELESLPFQRPNKPMSKELRELLYGKKYEPKKIEKKIIKPKKSNFEKYKSQILRYQDYLNDAEGNGEQEQLRHELFLIGKKMDKDKTLSSEEYGKLLDILYK